MSSKVKPSNGTKHPKEPDKVKVLDYDDEIAMSDPESESDDLVNIPIVAKNSDISFFYDENSVKMFNNFWAPQLDEFWNMDVCSIPGFHDHSHINSIRKLNGNISRSSKAYLDHYFNSMDAILPENKIYDLTFDPNKPKKKPEKKQENIASRKLRFYPITKDKHTLKRYFGTKRYLYNKTVEEIMESLSVRKEAFKDAQENGCLYTWEKKVKKRRRRGGSKRQITTEIELVEKRCGQELSNCYYCERHSNMRIAFNVPQGYVHWQSQMIRKKKLLFEEEKWLEHIPFDTRILATREAVDAYRSQAELLKQGFVKKINLGFKRRKDHRQSFQISANVLKGNCVLWDEEKYNMSLHMPRKERKWLDIYLKTFHKMKYPSKKK